MGLYSVSSLSTVDGMIIVIKLICTSLYDLLYQAYLKMNRIIFLIYLIVNLAFFLTVITKIIDHDSWV